MADGLLAQAIEIHRWLEQDRATPAPARTQRDRKIGITLADAKATEKLLNWWSQITGSKAPNNPGVGIRFWLSTGLLLAGLFVGGGLGSLALTYEGQHPINVLALLGVIVVLPGLFLLLTITAALARVLRIKPLARLLQGINLNRWVLGLMDRYLNIQLGPSFGQRNAQGRLAFWQVTLFSQWFGIGFYVGVTLMFLVLLAFTDLAFGWSSTLDIESASVQRWSSWLASPWAAWLPAAAPDMALIDGSRIYRVESATAALDGSLLRGWWPFVLMCILVWGLAPRCVAWIVARWRTREAERAYLLEHSEVVALLDRMNTPVIDRGLEGSNHPTPTLEITDHAAAVPLARPIVVTWNHAIEDLRLPNQIGQTTTLQSVQSEAERMALMQALQSELSHADGMAIFTKGWEPPLLEFKDLLESLRSTVGHSPSIVVMPVGLSGNALSESDFSIWHRFVDQMGDAHTYVVAGNVGASN